MLRRLANPLAALLVAGLLAPAPSRAEDFTPPKDGVFTEKQLTNWIEIFGGIINVLKQEGKMVQDSKSGYAALGAFNRVDARFKKLYADHNTTEPEMDWVGQQVLSGWVLIETDVAWEKSEQPALQKRVKEMEEQVAADKARLAAIDLAQKSGKRILTKEQRDAEIARANDQAASIDEEVKARTEEANAALAEAKEADAKAKAAEQAMKHPEGDDDDAKQAFAADKKSEMEAAQAAAKDSRDREAEARKNAKEAQDRADLWRKHAATPDVPMNDDERADAKRANDEEAARLQGELTELGQSLDYQRDVLKNGHAGGALDEARAKLPKANYDLLYKHRKEVRKVLSQPDPDYDK